MFQPKHRQKKYKNNLEEKIFHKLEKIYNLQNFGELDGFDDAYNKGLEIVYKELLEFDGGISENYLEGIENGLRILNEK